MFDIIKNSTITWIILSFCTVASLAYAIITGVKGKKRKQFTYAKKSNYIIQNKVKTIEKLDLKFDGKSIDVLTISTIVIWNSQNTEIRREDIVSEYELSINSEDNTEILDAKIIYENEPANKFSIKKLSSKKVVFDFEYVDRKEGFVVQIFHTGKSNSLKVDCKIKGGESIKQYQNISFSNNSSKVKKVRIFALIGTMLIDFLLGIASLGIIVNMSDKNEYQILKISVVVVLLFIIVFIDIYQLRKTIKSSVPSCFREYI